MNGSLYLRKATAEDVDLLFEWVNDKLVRESAFNTRQITIEEHRAWFERSLKDKDRTQYILMKENVPIGQVRIDKEGSEAEIDYSICAKERGNGYGKDIIGLLINTIKEEHPEIVRLVGRVKSANKASVQCFEKNGFENKYIQLELDLKKN